ncbi:MAG: glycosyl hydrolase family 18 protein [Clostridia bacterium]
MKKGKKMKNGEKRFYLYKLIIVIIFALITAFILKVAPNYIRNDITGKTNLVINNNNVTKNLKNDVIVKDGVVYISTKDLANFFDGNIFYDNKYDQIITSSDTKLATLKIDEKKVTINGAKLDIIASAIKENNEFYLPFSEISKSVYNVETEYISSTDTVVLVSLDRELIYANSSKNNSVKIMPTVFSRTIDKVEKGDNLTVVTSENVKDGWTKVTTENGKVGYVKTKTLVNEQKIRDKLVIENQIDGKISMVWDYFSQYASAPQRSEKIEGVNVVSPTFFSLQKEGKGNIVANVGTAGINYINWAHNNGYKVWAMVSNDSMKDTTSEILNDYKLREDLINNIITAVVTYNLDGINLDFENIYEADKDAFSRLVIELAPRLKELGKAFSVDVTAPDGSPDWSLCYDRNVIGEVADYIAFMAYDQNGISSPKEGTTAGYDWVEANIKKFIEREEVPAEKIILGIPFYTRIWTEKNGELDSFVVDMKDIYNNIPDSATIVWDDDLKQNYAEYQKNGKNYKVWIEDEKSIRCKLELVNTYNLAGACYWEKDRETQEIWNIVSEILNVK